MRLQQRRQGRQHQRLRFQIRRGDGQLSGQLTAHLADFLMCRIGLKQHGFAALKKQRARIGEAQLPRAAVEQTYAQLGFKLRHRAADRRGGDVLLA